MSNRISSPRRFFLPAFAFVLGLLLFGLSVVATTPAVPLVSVAAAQDAPTLSGKQQALARRYAQLESVLLRMAEINAQTNPKRSALLKKVLSESKDRLIDMRFDELIEILERHRLNEAVGNQETLERDLTDLLKLLESENRAQRRDEEKEKIAKLIKELDDLIHREKALKGKTSRADDPEGLEPEQKDVRDRADDLADKMAESQEIGPRSRKDVPDSPKTPEKPAADKPKTDPGDKRDENKPEDDKQGENKPPNEKSDDKPDGDTEDAEEVDKSLSPAQQAMQKSMKRMREAEKRLRKAEKDEATEAQEEAIAELQKAKAELEKILRQLREEELMQTLLWLDARIKKMLRAEKAIRDQTENLAKVPAANEGPGATDEGETGERDAGTDGENAAESARSRQVRLSRLAADQVLIMGDADAALIVLREDGTARAMTESLLQARFDMEEVRDRLTRGDTSPATLEVEQAIIDALEEMLEAIDQARKDAEERRQQQQEQEQQGGSPMSEDDQRLINILSELKMIRLMQARVYERTRRYEAMLGEEGADMERLRVQIEELARQQTRIVRILNDIDVGKNE